MKLYIKILLFLLIVLIGIQFIQPTHNYTEQVLLTDITKTSKVPDNVLTTFKNACYDCHSNKTRYPWYVYIQPAGWIMAGHISNGKENLNFSEFGTYSQRKQVNKLRAIESSIRDGSMPFPSYKIMHSEASLNAVDKRQIFEWIANAKDSLSKNKLN